MEPDKIIEITSEKYSVKGHIEDYARGLVIKLKFTYGGREYDIGLPISNYGDDLAGSGLKAMESVIERLVSFEKIEKSLHYWYIFKHDGSFRTFGIVTGHPMVSNSSIITTSPIASVKIDEERGEALITTEHSDYHCPLEYWDFGEQDKHDEVKELIPNHEALKEKYHDKIFYPEIEHGKVLLVLADFCSYYFHSLCVKDENGKKLEYMNHAHVGMFQDSYLISLSWNNPAEIREKYDIDLRYFPHYKNIEFYKDRTGGKPLYAENIGSSDIYIKRHDETYRLQPGERKELVKENAETEVGYLHGGDLYPAGM